jgi:hypothetical protein
VTHDNPDDLFRSCSIRPLGSNADPPQVWRRPGVIDWTAHWEPWAIRRRFYHWLEKFKSLGNSLVVPMKLKDDSTRESDDRSPVGRMARPF